MQHLTPHLGWGPVLKAPITPIIRTANSYKAFIMCQAVLQILLIDLHLLALLILSTTL